MLKGNNLTPVYSFWGLWFSVNLLSTDKYYSKHRNLLEVSKSSSEATPKGLASDHLKAILSKSQCTGTIKNIINEVILG